MIELAPSHLAWLKSIVKDGPTAYCLDTPRLALIRKGLARMNAQNKLEPTDKGRQVAKCTNGEPSTFTKE